MKIFLVFFRRVAWVIGVSFLIAWFIFKSINDGVSRTALFEIELSAFICFGSISFPLGPMAAWVINAFATLFQVEVPDVHSSTISIFVAGITCLVGGYIQWFHIVPTLVSYFKKKRKATRDK